MDLQNYPNWNFKELNLIFGTDSEPFMLIVDQSGVSHFLAVPLDLRLKNHQSVARVSDDEVVLAGGVNYSFNSVSQSVFKFNLRTRRVTKLEKMANRKFFAEMVLFEGKLVSIAGREYGNDSVSIMPYCEAYNFDTETWESFPDLLVGRCNFSALVVDESLFVVGGIGGSSQSIDQIELFNRKKNKWEVLGIQLEQGLVGHLVFSRDKELLIMGGNKSASNGMCYRVDYSDGADLGDFRVSNLKKMNVLSKPIRVAGKILVLGGYHNHKFLVDLEKMKVSENKRKLNKFNELTKRIHDNCFQHFFLSKCSFLTAANSIKFANNQ